MASNPRVFILPNSSDNDTNTILTFKHPNTNIPTRYLIHHPTSPSTSTSTSTSTSNSSSPSTPFIYEILKVSNSPYAPRSWLIAPDTPPLSLPDPNASTEGTSQSKEDNPKDSLVIKDAHLYLTTPFDPIYLLLSHLSSQKTSRNFLSLDDLLESHPESAKWSKLLSIHPQSSQILQSRLLSICDTVSIGENEQMFRLNQEKLYTLLISRVEAVAKALPSSLVKHIAKKLSKPIGTQISTSWKRQSEMKPADKSGGIINDAELEDQDEDTQEPVTEGVESQLRREASKLNLEDTADTPMGEEETEIIEENLLPPEEIQYICHLSHSLQFFQNYLPQEIYTSLSERLNKVHSQEPLETYFEELKALRAAANAALDFSMSHSKRRLEDLEAGGGRTKEDVEREKKRKKKEEDAKKSTAVKKLEKVDTKGMMKMTAFFKKKDP
ncbi:hypothetical protein TWF225_007770 [Orbilia oligospora]|nr:hypothetical protein TWF225_007770 [Orbilia oligospora]KAF3235832.1 hypothetical protein TWF217_002847 [Orbilia oligospora]KAF3242101.1 hypothetical protein TWF128_010579 [Orbilia oligospora]